MKKRISLIFFNASVVLAGFRSPKGGSGKILSWVKQKKIKGVISEIILDEILRNAQKIKFTKAELAKQVKKTLQINQAPSKESVSKFKDIILDFGDAHVLASSKEEKADYLVTLDQKHLLILKDKIGEFKIVTPGQLIEIINFR